MQFKLFKTQDADNVIGKVLTGELVLDIFLRSQIDIKRPMISLVDVPNLQDYNYCTIPELGMSYFIRDFNLINAQVTQVVCELDYLETYKDKILLVSGTVRRRAVAGDYGVVQLDETGREVSTNYFSDVELLEGSGAILSVLRGEVV